MTNQLNLQRNEKSIWAKLWFLSKVFLLSFITIILVAAALAAIPTIYVFSIGVIILFLLAIFGFKRSIKQSVKVKVENQHLKYFCPVKKENIIIPTSEIINVTSQFCELQIHTSNHTYCLNLNSIRQEKQRWEIKEMIKKLVPNQENKAVNF